jgi:hypothetical protein
MTTVGKETPAVTAGLGLQGRVKVKGQSGWEDRGRAGTDCTGPAERGRAVCAG